MVKVKKSAKSKSKKNEQLMPAWKKVRASGSSSKRTDFTTSCCECGETIDDDTNAVQCERCVGHETWKCAGCLDLSDELYELLASSSKCNFHWFCDKCESVALDTSSSPPSSCQNEISTMLMKLEENLLEKVNAIEVRLTKIEVKPVATEEVQQRLEHKMDQIRTNNEPVVQAVQEAIQEDKAEEVEIDRRKTNVIIHGVAESDDDNADQRIDDDSTVLAAMFHELKVENVKVESIVRLGKRAVNPAQNPRPMKVVLDSVDSKLSILRKAKNLRELQDGNWSKVFVHQDLTPKQREARKPLVVELKARKASGEKDLTIYNGKVVKKRGFQ